MSTTEKKVFVIGYYKGHLRKAKSLFHTSIKSTSKALSEKLLKDKSSANNGIANLSFKSR